MHDDDEGFLEVRIKGGWELDPDHPGCVRSEDGQLIVIFDRAGFLILQRSQLEAWQRGDAVPTTPPFSDLTDIPGINEGLASAAERAGIDAEIAAAWKEGRDALFTTDGTTALPSEMEVSAWTAWQYLAGVNPHSAPRTGTPYRLQSQLESQTP